MGTRRLWSALGWRTGPAPAVDPLVVDSWLVRDGTVRGLDRHFARFAAAVTRLVGTAEGDLADFLDGVPARVPGSGAWFPRVEAYVDGGLALWVRPAPPLAATTRLWVPPAPDPRGTPTVKGPDLATLAVLRGQAVLAGADDAVLWAPDGSVVETASAALFWWRDGALHRPAAPALPSVTAGLLEDLARRHGLRTRRARLDLTELTRCPVWTVNALHGLRHVDGPRLDDYAGRPFDRWRAELADTAIPRTRQPVATGGIR